jgi:hypothetical protein
MRHHRWIHSVLLACYVSACTQWVVQTAAPEQTFSDSSYVRKGVRVTTSNSQRVEIVHPRLTGDTITGLSKNSAGVSIPLQDIRELAVKRPDLASSVGLVIGLMAGAAALTAAAVCIAWCGSGFH